MAFSDYKNIDQALASFSLTDQIEDNLFPDVRPVEPGPALTFFLDLPAQWAMVQQSETIRSQAIIAPFLFEAASRAAEPTIVFSETALNVSP